MRRSHSPILSFALGFAVASTALAQEPSASVPEGSVPPAPAVVEAPSTYASPPAPPTTMAPYGAPTAVPPPPGYPTTNVPPVPFVYTANGWVATDPAATTAALDRADRGLGIERVGIIVGAVGMAVRVVGAAFLLTSYECGTYDCWITDPSRYDAAAAVTGIGYAIGAGGLVAGGSGALMASNQLRALGVPNHRRGLAIASLVLGFFPLQLPALIMEAVHASRTRAIVQDLRLTVQPRASFGFAPLVQPESRSFGSRFVLRF